MGADTAAGFAFALTTGVGRRSQPGPCLDPKYFPKFYYAKRRFFITSKCWHMHRVLNVDEIKN
jgi:hypothetical protein